MSMATSLHFVQLHLKTKKLRGVKKMFIKTVAEVLTLGQAVELHNAGICVVGEDGKVFLTMEGEE